MQKRKAKFRTLKEDWAWVWSGGGCKEGKRVMWSAIKRQVVGCGIVGRKDVGRSMAMRSRGRIEDSILACTRSIINAVHNPRNSGREVRGEVVE
jgi:hypothetical protein